MSSSSSLIDLTDLDHLLDKAKANLLEKHEHVITFQEDKEESKREKRPLTLDPGVKLNSLTYLQKSSETRYGPVSIKPELRMQVVDEHDTSNRKQKKTLAQPLVQVQVPKLENKTPKSLDYTLDQKKKLMKETSGPGWFNMSRPDITDEMKRDLHLLRNRSALDPKRHYKKNTISALPKYFQVGTVIDAGSSTITRSSVKVKKRSLVEELLADRQSRQRLKSKYLEIQEKKNNVTRKRRFSKFKKTK